MYCAVLDQRISEWAAQLLQWSETDDCDWHVPTETEMPEKTARWISSLY